MALLKFLFIFILMVLLVGLVMGATLVMRFVTAIRKAVRQFNGNTTQQDSRRRGSQSANENVIDQRGSQQANRKIFSSDEGEYVDFEEVE